MRRRLARPGPGSNRANKRPVPLSCAGPLSNRGNQKVCPSVVGRIKDLSLCDARGALKGGRTKDLSLCRSGAALQRIQKTYRIGGRVRRSKKRRK